MPLTAGIKLGPYEIVAPLGAGGMGEVYRARDTRLNREVAVKVLPDHLSVSEEFRQRFEREARSASSLNHPNICTIHDIGSDDGIDYLVMELLAGETLSERLARGPLPVDELLALAVPLADALDRAHSSGLIHRDLKPGNVMLTPEGPKLLDFGLAKGLEAAASSDLTATPTMTSPLTAVGSIVGTFQYMAPEQLEGREADIRSDLWAFGTMLYEMATGVRAFAGQTQASLIASIIKEDPRSTPEIVPSIPSHLDHIIQRCLAKNPEDRWQTIRDVAAELKWIQAGGGLATAVESTAPAVVKRSMPPWVWAAAAALGGLLFTAGWLFKQPAPPPQKLVRSSLVLEKDTALDNQNKMLALSPDGTRLAYAATNENTSGIWVRRLDSLQAQHLAGTEGATYPTWSPDGGSLAFFTSGKLRKIPAGGGTAQTICDAGDGRGIAWGTSGIIVFAPSPFGGLKQVAAAGGTPTVATSEERKDWTHRNPHFLPDGKRLLFFMGPPTAAADEGTISSLDLATGETQEILRVESEGVFVEPGYLAFVRDGNLMAQPMDPASLELTAEAVPLVEEVQFNTFRWTGAYSFSRDGLLVYQTGALQTNSRLTWFDLEGTELGTVGEPAPFWFSPAISPDGRRAVVSIRRDDGQADLWMYDLQRGLGSRFTFGDPGIAPIWSPDGKQIAYSLGGAGLRIKGADGSSPAQDVTTDVGFFISDWHPDGSHLLTNRVEDDLQMELLVTPVAGEEDSRVVLSSPANEFTGQFSPDGRWLAFLSDESGRQELYVSSFPVPGGKWQISTAGAASPSGEIGNSYEWLPDGTGIIYRAADGDLLLVAITVQDHNLQIGAARPLFGGRFRELGLGGWALSHDGKKILAPVLIERAKAPVLTLVTNWAAGLDSSR